MLTPINRGRFKSEVLIIPTCRNQRLTGDNLKPFFPIAIVTAKSAFFYLHNVLTYINSNKNIF
jgi:hypothetical protein